jgi:hypothetical protein
MWLISSRHESFDAPLWKKYNFHFFDYRFRIPPPLALYSKLVINSLEPKQWLKREIKNKIRIKSKMTTHYLISNILSGLRPMRALKFLIQVNRVQRKVNRKIWGESQFSTSNLNFPRFIRRIRYPWWIHQVGPCGLRNLESVKQFCAYTPFHIHNPEP